MEPPFETVFTLTKDYLAESFDQSLPYGSAARPNVWLPAAAIVAGICLLAFTQQPGLIVWMFIALGTLELVHIRFRRSWWLFRQTWGKSHELKITLKIDEQGIETSSSAASTRILWAEIDEVIETELGMILVTQRQGRHYLSKSILPEASVDRLRGFCT